MRSPAVRRFAPVPMATGLFAVLMSLACAASPPDPSDRSQHLGDPEIERSGGFESYHPDLRNRRLGNEARAAGRSEEARVFFRRGARYADKLSQAAYAEMLWNGEGGPADRALAYAWMDLAAQRGAPALVVLRERYWHQMAAAERERAVREGEAIHAEFGDASAKPRIERQLRRGLAAMNGSRVGDIGPIDICIESDHRMGKCGAQRRADAYYADHYWQPDAYFRWQDGLLQTPIAGR